jgi:hypothetical protein
VTRLGRRCPRWLPHCTSSPRLPATRQALTSSASCSGLCRLSNSLRLCRIFSSARIQGHGHAHTLCASVASADSVGPVLHKPMMATLRKSRPQSRATYAAVVTCCSDETWARTVLTEASVSIYKTARCHCREGVTLSNMFASLLGIAQHGRRHWPRAWHDVGSSRAPDGVWTGVSLNVGHSPCR